MTRPAVEEDPAETRIEALVGEHRDAVFTHALSLTRGDADWAEDVVQETFLRAWQHSERMTPERGSVRGWLLRVAHNLVMDGYRSARMRRGETLLDEAALDVVGQPAAPEWTDQVLSAQLAREALRRLPEVHQRALAATYLSDQTAEQAARRLDVPVGTVKSRVFYGLRRLRSDLNPTAASGLAASGLRVRRPVVAHWPHETYAGT